MLRFPFIGWGLPDKIPGAAGQPIYEWLLERRDAELEAFPSLPDDDRQREPGKVGFVAGAWDGVIQGTSRGAEVASEVGELLIKALQGRTPSEARLAELYGHLTKESTLEYIDALLPRLARSRKLDATRLRLLVLWLIHLAPDRSPVKVAIGLLNVVGKPEDRDILMTVGGHDEFTLYSVVALKNLLLPSESRSAIWALAKRTQGWGRIQAVRRLDADLEPEIRDWMLREGFRNAVMDEELAYLVATTADLAGALNQPEIDRALFRGAGDLLVALIDSPFKGINDYQDARDAVERYLRYADRMADSLEDYLAIRRVHAFLTAEDKSPESRTEGALNPSARIELISLSTAVLERPGWLPLATAALSDPDRSRFATADQVARSLGVNTAQAHLARLDADTGLDGWHWQSIFAQTPAEEMPRMIELAEKRIQPERIGTGAALEAGVGKEFVRHRTVDTVLGVLNERPGLGLSFVLPALRSPVIRNRWLAAQVLGAWGRDRWPAEVDDALSAAVALEPQQKNREFMTSLLA